MSKRVFAFFSVLLGRAAELSRTPLAAFIDFSAAHRVSPIRYGAADLAARKLAQREGFRVQGTIGILEACFRRGYLSDLRETYELPI